MTHCKVSFIKNISINSGHFIFNLDSQYGQICASTYFHTFQLLPYLLFFLFSVPAESLNNLRAHIPDTVIRGHNAVFNCTFNFDEDETLYAIKWYRGTYEIFRYIPSDDPPTKRFPLAGYNVSVSIQSIHSILT